MARLVLHQIERVDVPTRAGNPPAVSRLGGYDTALLDRVAPPGGRDRRLFEDWAQEVSRLPLALQPLPHRRMARVRPRRMALLDRIREDAPLATSDIADSRPG